MNENDEKLDATETTMRDLWHREFPNVDMSMYRHVHGKQLTDLRDAALSELARTGRCPVHGIPDCSPLLNACSYFTNPEGVSA